jgi:hypothetical protein
MGFYTKGREMSRVSRGYGPFAYLCRKSLKKGWLFREAFPNALLKVHLWNPPIKVSPTGHHPRCRSSVLLQKYRPCQPYLSPSSHVATPSSLRQAIENDFQKYDQCLFPGSDVSLFSLKQPLPSCERGRGPEARVTSMSHPAPQKYGQSFRELCASYWSLNDTESAFALGLAEAPNLWYASKSTIRAF